MKYGTVSLGDWFPAVRRKWCSRVPELRGILEDEMGNNSPSDRSYPRINAVRYRTNNPRILNLSMRLG